MSRMRRTPFASPSSTTLAKLVTGVTADLPFPAMSHITSIPGPPAGRGEHAPAISLRAATKRFPTKDGGAFTAIRDVTLDVAAGEFVAIVGPTGCGKSTTLSLVSGLEPASEGTVHV